MTLKYESDATDRVDDTNGWNTREVKVRVSGLVADVGDSGESCSFHIHEDDRPEGVVSKLAEVVPDLME